VGSSVYFHVPRDPKLYTQLPGGAEIWGGYKQAVKPCQGGLQLNLDAAATAFLTAGPLLDLLAGALGMRDRGALAREQPNPRMQRALKDLLRGVRVRAPTSAEQEPSGAYGPAVQFLTVQYTQYTSSSSFLLSTHMHMLQQQLAHC
jgi:hypothetical protein